jgi:hypothetical protein
MYSIHKIFPLVNIYLLYLYADVSNGKQKPVRFSLISLLFSYRIRLPFAHCAYGSLSFVRLLMKN